jgi:hypothetical protein
MDKTQAQLDLNASACIQSASSIGHTTYINICNGVTHIVQWGSLDWLGFVAATAFLAALAVGGVLFVWCMLND